MGEFLEFTSYLGGLVIGLAFLCVLILLVLAVCVAVMYELLFDKKVKPEGEVDAYLATLDPETRERYIAYRDEIS